MNIPNIYNNQSIINKGIQEFDDLATAEKQGYRVYDYDRSLKIYLLRIFVNDRWAFALAKDSE